METQHDFIMNLNAFLNPPMREKEKEPEPEPEEDYGDRNFYNKEKPKYKKKPLNKIFNLENKKSIKYKKK